MVLGEMNRAGTKLNILILDACRNNPFGPGPRGLVRVPGGRGMSPSDDLSAPGAGLAQMLAPRGTLIAYATQPGNVASDGDYGDSPFTVALARTIPRPGMDIFRTFNEVGLLVDRATAGQQQPWVSTSPIEGDFQFVPSVAQPAPAPNGAPVSIPKPVNPPPPMAPATAGPPSPPTFPPAAAVTPGSVGQVAVLPAPRPTPGMPSPPIGNAAFSGTYTGYARETRGSSSGFCYGRLNKDDVKLEVTDNVIRYPWARGYIEAPIQPDGSFFGTGRPMIVTSGAYILSGRITAGALEADVGNSACAVHASLRKN